MIEMRKRSKYIGVRGGENLDFESCTDCIHVADHIDICILRRCVHAIQELEECYQNRENKQSPENQWTPIKEGLPKKDGQYLVSIGLPEHRSVVSTLMFYNNPSKAIGFNRQTPCFIDLDDFGYYEVSNVIAWMNRPKPYRDEKG